MRSSIALISPIATPSDDVSQCCVIWQPAATGVDETATPGAGALDGPDELDETVCGAGHSGHIAAGFISAPGTPGGTNALTSAAHCSASSGIGFSPKSFFSKSSMATNFC